MRTNGPVNAHGGHLSHVIWIIYVHIGSDFLKMLYVKLGFDWLKEEDIMVIYLYIAPGLGHTSHWGPIFSE